MTGKTIEFKSNGEMYHGYLAEADHPAPGVIVIQEWWGLVDHIRDVCDRFAKEGFTALAPDVFHGKKTKSPDEASKLFMALNIADAEKILRGAVDALLAQPSCSSKTVGVIGFCMGGQLALYAACTNPEKISACADFYGVHPSVLPPFQNLKAPVLGIFGEKDSSVNPGVVSKLSARLKELGKQHDFHTYKDRPHAFFNDTRPEVFHKDDAADAWQRTLEFFRSHVR